MVAYEKIYFEAHTNDQNIWHKDNNAQLYFIFGELSYVGNFPVDSGMPLIPTDFQ